MAKKSSLEQILGNKSVEEQLEFYKDMYDTIIKFDDYYYKMFPDWDGVFNTHCRLHDEDTAGKPSFSYTPIMNMWTCFGKCQAMGHGHGRVVFYHYIFRKKLEPTFTLYKALKEVYKMFSQSPTDRYNKPVEDYKTLPYPKIYQPSLKIATDLDNLQASIAPPTEGTIDVNTVKLFTESNSTLSCRVLANFLTKKDKSNTYKDSFKIKD